VTPADLALGRAADRAAIVDAPYRVTERTDARLVAECLDDGLVVRKNYEVGGDRARPWLTLAVSLENRADRRVDGRVGIEWNLMFLGGGGNPAAFTEVAGERLAHDSTGAASGVEEVAAGNTDVGCLLTTTVAPAADAWWFPIDTISNSEGGFERVYQGSCLTFSWPVTLAPGERFEATIRHRIEATRDHAAEEAALVETAG
jgi:hypothetical protein